MRRLACALFVLVLIAPLAWADVVYLKTGGTISGTVIREDEKVVVVKTPDGKVTLPRHMVARIVKQSQGQTLLALARERAKAGAYAEAEKLFKRATRSSNPEVAKAAKSELAAFRGRLTRSKGYRQAPRTVVPLPEGVSGTPIDGQTLQDQFDRARRAIETGNGLRALRLLDPLLKSKPNDRVLTFLVGRAHEESGKPDLARSEFKAALGDSWRRSKRSVPWLSELARRKLAGLPFRSKAPGVGEQWKRIETKHFAIYHDLASAPAWLAREAEKAMQDVLEAFGIKQRELYFAGRIQVFLYSARGWRRSEGLEPTQRHAIEVPAPDGIINIIRARADAGHFRVQFVHQVGHAVLNNVFDLPLWALEGGASYVEPRAARAKLRRALAGRTLHDPMEFLAGKVPRGDTRLARETYRGQAAVLFEVFVQEKESPRTVVKLCQMIGRDGPEKALKRFKLDPEVLPDAFEDLLRSE